MRSRRCCVSDRPEESSRPYRAEVLEQLWRHGVHPKRETPPQLVRDYVRDLYRYEIRRLKRRLLAGEFPKERYLDLVIELRMQYWLLSIPVARWVRTK